MEFGNKLYELRKKSGLSQEELAGKLNVTRQTVSKWELGESSPDMEKLIALCDLFELSLDELVFNKKPEPPAPEQPTVPKAIPIDRRKLKKAGWIVLIVCGVLFAVDLVSMVIYFIVNGIPT